MAFKLSRTASRQCDVALGSVPEDELGRLIVQELKIKAFCVIDPKLKDGETEKALDEAKDIDSQGRFRDVHPTISDGLLGESGTSRLAELDPTNQDTIGFSNCEALTRLDNLMRNIGGHLGKHVGSLGFVVHSRGQAMLHENGDPRELVPTLTETEAWKWRSTFLRYNVMMIIFLGPSPGRLVLEPYFAEDAREHVVRTLPGTMVLLRADILSHKHSAIGKAISMSSFLLGPETNKRNYTATKERVRAAIELDQWIDTRSHELKELEEEFMKNNAMDSWDPDLPTEWKRELNHVGKGKAGGTTGICGAACKFPCEDELSSWFWTGTGGIDYAIDVPAVRWNHLDIYDPDPEGWKQQPGKSYCRHATFVDGIELFDAPFFRLPLEEAKQMDPHQRLTLEVSYSALYRMGKRRKHLMNWPCSVYVGCGNYEWGLKVDKFGGPCAGGGSQSMSAGRLSFIMGMRGPNMVVDAEGASGMVALDLAADSVQNRGDNTPGVGVGGSRMEHALAIGVSLCLSPVLWPAQCASGWLSFEGRCLTFNSTADGYVRGEGCCSAVVELQGTEEDRAQAAGPPLLGSLVGISLGSSGTGATMSTPHGPSEQQVMSNAVGVAKLSVYDIDCVEGHGSGNFLADAVEVGSLLRVHRSESYTERLVVAALKTSVGHQLECGGLSSFLRSLYAARYGQIMPNLHFKALNEHIDEDDPVGIIPEVKEFGYPGNYLGVFSRGLGGSNVYAVAFGEILSQVSQEVRPLSDADTLVFWPAGGGELSWDMRPNRSYTIFGTWNNWTKGADMQPEGDGSYGFTVTLGENRWEAFQIWLDGQSDRVLHPGRAQASKDVAVIGPEDSASCHGMNWMIDGRTENTMDTGMPGDQYRVLLRIAGRWRTVHWEKKASTISLPIAPPSGGTGSKYYVRGSWSQFELEEMEADPSNPGFYSLEVQLKWLSAAEFQIFRNRDGQQAFYPPEPKTDAEKDPRVMGPDANNHGKNWHMEGEAGDRMMIYFQRTWDETGEVKKVSWEKLHRSENITQDQLSPPRYMIRGSWDDWEKLLPMTWDGTCFKHTVTLEVDGGEVNFELAKDPRQEDRGNLPELFYPNCRRATPYSFHTVQGPGSNPHRLFWTVGRNPKDKAEPGARYEVKMFLGKDRPKKVEWSKVDAT